MGKPAILLVDDDVQVLNAVERDLRAHFRGVYRLVKAVSGAEALEAAHQLKRRAVPLALFLVDQRMPVMSGTEFLAQVRPLYPQAKKVLLTAYADTAAAITSINQIGLDYYLMKPWDPPEQNLYPVLDDLLDDWKVNTVLPYDGIRVAGTLWSERSHAVKDFLARNQVPYQWLDIEKDEEARQMVQAAGAEPAGLPVIFFPDGTALVQPDLTALAEKVGMQTRAAMPFYDFAIIGAGPAGLAAAVYAASEGLRTVMIEREAAGGQAGTSSRIENYLGFPNGLSGADLARRAVAQAKRFGVEIITAREVTGLRVEDSYRYLLLSDGSEISAHAVLIATGVSVRRLEAPGVERLTGAGIYYGAALTEAANYRGQPVVIVGGANSAGQAAVYFSQYAQRVTVLVRGDALAAGMSQYLVDQIRAAPNIDVLVNVEVTAVSGENRLEEICLIDRYSGAEQMLQAAAMFIFIGAVPRTDLAGSLVARDSAGFILTGPELYRKGQRPAAWTQNRDPFLLETSCPGIFAAGDVRHGSVKRVGSAVGEGAVTVAFVHQYLKTV